MNSASGSEIEQQLRIVETEYVSLREEMVKRIEGRQQIISITLTLAGAFLGIGWGSGGAVPILIYPSLAFLLALSWAQSEIRIFQIGEYIHQRLESSIPQLGWEKYWREHQGQTRLFGLPIALVASAGIFLLTQIMAVVLGVLRFTGVFPEWIMLMVDVVIILLTFGVARWVQQTVIQD